MRRELKRVKAKFLRPSSILPQREPDKLLAESVERDGLQYPIIVRPCPVREGAFEIIDGHLRHKYLDPEREVLVDIRYDVDDEEVFRISESTFKRKDRNTFERALFYAKWVEIAKSKYGEWGAQAKVARESGLSEAQISQYLTIHKLFETLLEKGANQKIFDALKNQSINKLYELSRITDSSALLKAADFLANNPNISLEELKQAIEQIRQELDRKEQALIDEITEALREDLSQNLTYQQHLSSEELEEMVGKLEDKLDATIPRLRRLKNSDITRQSGTINRLLKIIKRILRAFKDIEKELRGLEAQNKNSLNTVRKVKKIATKSFD